MARGSRRWLRSNEGLFHDEQPLAPNRQIDSRKEADSKKEVESERTVIESLLHARWEMNFLPKQIKRSQEKQRRESCK